MKLMGRTGRMNRDLINLKNPLAGLSCRGFDTLAAWQPHPHYRQIHGGRSRSL